ncbi:MAG: hypothetical protein KDK69_06685 [Chlamydiia bacterium]|nr:hypothetical protein [Chlamydiia bacterium]
MDPIRENLNFNLAQTGFFLAGSLLAGTSRFIAYFPQSTPGGLLCSGVIGSAFALSTQFIASEQESPIERCTRVTLSYLLGSLLVSPQASKLLGSRVTITLTDTFRFSIIVAVINSLIHGMISQVSNESSPPRERYYGALFDKLQGTEETLINWKDVSPQDQRRLQGPLGDFALGSGIKTSIGMWDDRKVADNLQKGFQLESYLWKLEGDRLTAQKEGTSFTLDLSEVRVAHHPSLSSEEVHAYLKQEDIHEVENRHTRGGHIAIRGPIAYQHQIVKREEVQLVELPALKRSEMIWACWPNKGRQKTASSQDLETYRKELLVTLELIHSLTANHEVMSIVVPRAFMPQRYEAVDSVENLRKASLYYAYRKVFIETVHQFANSKKKHFLIHAVQKNEAPVIHGLKLGERDYCSIAPLEADADITGERLVEQGFKVVHLCTGNQVGHIGNAAQYNKGGCAKDERDVRIAMVSYLAIFSGIVNPHLIN